MDALLTWTVVLGTIFSVMVCCRAYEIFQEYEVVVTPVMNIAEPEFSYQPQHPPFEFQASAPAA